MLAGAYGVAGATGGAAYALMVTATDQTASGTPSVSAALNVVAGSTGDDVIRLASLPGIAASAPTFLYALGGSDTIDATGMTGTVFFDGGSGGVTATGGSGTNVYEFGAALTPSGSAADSSRISTSRWIGST